MLSPVDASDVVLFPPNLVNSSITIIANDTAAGVFSFAADSIAISVPESPMSLLVNVTRTRGAFGASFVFWVLDDECIRREGLAPSSGLVSFADGQRTAVSSYAFLTGDAFY